MTNQKPTKSASAEPKSKATALKTTSSKQIKAAPPAEKTPQEKGTPVKPVATKTPPTKAVAPVKGRPPGKKKTGPSEITLADILGESVEESPKSDESIHEQSHTPEGLLPEPKLVLPWDVFVFEVDQAILARYNSRKKEFRSHLRFEPFLKPETYQEWVSSLSQTPVEWSVLWKHICQHHWQILPQYKHHESITSDTISWFSHSFAVLWADLSLAHQAIFNSELPDLPVTPGTDEISTFWKAVFATHVKVFGDAYSGFWRSYMQWFYQQKNRDRSKKKVDVTKIDWRVHPPCGAAYRAYLDYLEDNPGLPMRDDRPTQAARPERTSAPRPPRIEEPRGEVVSPESTEERPSRPALLPRPERTERGESRPSRGGRPPRSREEKSDSTVRLEVALQEAKEAVLKMGQDVSLTALVLRPQNSFVRRQQHVIISSAGFGTESRGEGYDRHVCVVRVSSPQ